MYICNKCYKEFKLLGDYKRHINRKRPCNIKTQYKCSRCQKIYIDKRDFNKHLNRKTPCQSNVQRTSINNNKITSNKNTQSGTIVPSINGNNNPFINGNKNTIINTTNNNNTTNINNNINNTINANIQFNTIALTPDNFNVDKININDIANEEIGLSDIIYKGTRLPNGKSNYVCTDTSRSTYNRLTEDGKWELDPKGQYLKRSIYPKIAAKLEKVYDDYEISNTCNTYDQLMDLLISKSKMVRPSDDFYDKALRKLAPKVYVSRRKLKNYLKTV